MFYPSRGTNQVVTPAAASASINVACGYNAMMLANSGAKVCYVRVGSGSLTATIADIPVLPGNYIVVGKAADDDVVAYVSADGTTLNIQPGQEVY